jgi:hypothetical protein
MLCFSHHFLSRLKMKLQRFLTSAVFAAALCAAGAAHSSLTTSASFTGAGVGLSTSGWGSITQSGNITADVPAGATVLAAYLYTSTFGWNSSVGGTLAGNVVTYTQLGAVNWGGEAGRSDVTSIVKPLIDGGVGGTYSFSITETQSTQDGSALVVIYKDPSNTAVQSVGILDGFSLTTGDSTAINFADPLDKTLPGFKAEMRLGIGFSYDEPNCTEGSQYSTVTVNGTTITQRAGCNDDKVAAEGANNGNLITVGGNNDPFSPLLPSIAQDHERYDLTGNIANGDTSIQIRTLNPSTDDNIFLAAFLVTGNAGFNEPPDNDVPEPETLALLGLALAGLGVQRRLAKRV